MPKGIFTGFVINENIKADTALVALLKNRRSKNKEDQYELIYIDKNGKKILENHKEVLDFLSKYKDKVRDVPENIDNSALEDIKELQDMLYKWIDSLSGTKTKNLLGSLKVGNKKAMEQVKSNITIEEEFNIDNYDLIVWFVVS